MAVDTFAQPVIIDKSSSVTDIVLNDYRMADVFLKYNIEFCCGGKWPLEMVCTSKNLDITEVLLELEKGSRAVHVANKLNFHNWSTAFLINFIVNVHHEYLRSAAPIALEYVNRFMEGHLSKFPELQQLQEVVTLLHKEALPHLLMEEETLFPYIDQITNAYTEQEPYGGLLVRTLRKPLQVIMQQEHELFKNLLHKMREITHQYSVPANACITHKVTFSKLQELDNDLSLHLYLENEVLFPRAIEIEKKLLV